MPGKVNRYHGLTLVILLQLVTVVVKGYHLPLSEDIFVHCWPLDANEEDDDTIDCNGLDMVWNEIPPFVVFQGDVVTLSVNITANESFFSSENILQIGSGNSSGSGQGLEQFCQEDCRKECRDVAAEDCCVWHSNVHICFPIAEFCGDEPVCGPWIRNISGISTQTHSKCGALGTYSEEIKLYVPGINTIIYHMIVGNLQIVLGTYTIVEFHSCGDGKCQRIEQCEYCPKKKRDIPCVVCPEDCCPLGWAIFFGVSFGILFFIVAVTVTLITLPIVVCVVWRKKKQMKDESWVISYNDIIISTGKKAMSSLASFQRKDNKSTISTSMQDLQIKQIFTEMGSYKGRPVAIRRIHRKQSWCGSTISTKMRKEVLQIRTLDHQNLCKFIGATVKDSPPNVAIISEYCPKGSLNDVLQNDTIPLNWNFRFSFAEDIARGMAFLHSHGVTHGRLTSSNCVIDDRWVTKVTDFGLPGLRYSEGERGGEGEERKSVIPKVYRAPEVRDLLPSQVASTTSADVYSYAIILFEIATRKDPRSEDDLQLDATLKPKIKQTQLDETECPCSQDYLQLIHKCWTFSPPSRHSFDRVRKALRDINPSHNSAIDNMMLMMEKYSKHLEQLVGERTEELEEEKERAMSLLYRMIPETVAEDLKQGKAISAQTFAGATIFFSDIVGFTTLAGSSSPMEIVNLLNKLYTEFDQILDLFDVYKVETIGDAYMVVSGVPQANGDKHAGEIAKMALKLMECCETFTIPHRPDTKLEIRAGIHSGSVCAGVVGQKMPRYCLFGDTVNTASRMESNSIAMHVQCSDATYQLLNQLGGFEMISRGVIEVKGKGSMSTWWLVGYTEPDIAVRPPTRLDTPNSPTTKEPIREPPKKYSFNERSLDSRSTSSLQSKAVVVESPNSNGSDAESHGVRSPSVTGEFLKKHWSLYGTSSYPNLLSVDGGERGDGERHKQTRSTLLQGSGSATELAPAKTSVASIARSTAGVRHSVPNVPQIRVNGLSTDTRRRATLQSVGLGASSRESRKPSSLSQTSISNRDCKQLAVTPLDDKQDTTL